MTDRFEPLGPLLAACISGIVGTITFIFGLIWLGWICIGCFALIMLWMIMAQPAINILSDSRTTAFWRISNGGGNA